MATVLISLSSYRSTRYQRRINKFFSWSNEFRTESDLQSRLIAKLPNRELIQTKLDLLELGLTVRKLRVRQFSYAIGGASFGILLNLVSLTDPNPLLRWSIPLFGVLGWQYPISSLNSRYQKLKDDLNFGFAEIADLIALSVTAGNSLSSALIQVSESVLPPWQNQLTIIRLELASGLSVTSCLERAARRLQHPTFTKFVTAILLTLERGTPLSAQLRVQANEVAELLRRDLLNQAGKKETAMLLPVVFLILPTIVIATLFPGVMALGKLI